jgi:hypothetical protein
MNKSNSCICLFPLTPVFNTDFIPVFESMNTGDSSLLRSILYENFVEVLNNMSESSTNIYCVDEKDKDHIPSNMGNSMPDIKWIDTSVLNKELRNFSDKYFKRFQNNVIIFADSIGISSQDIKKIFSLLEMEDESFLMGRGNDERIALVGFNTYNEELLGNIIEDRYHYNELLIKASKNDNFVHTLNDFMVIEKKEDFKKLYTELSKKESLNYCSQDIHEKFTHLFIEYKDLLK